MLTRLTVHLKEPSEEQILGIQEVLLDNGLAQNVSVQPDFASGLLTKDVVLHGDFVELRFDRLELLCSLPSVAKIILERNS